MFDCISEYFCREIDRGAQVCIEMKGNQTWIWDVADLTTKRSFAFDYSYWSHDGFHIDSTGLSVPDNDHYSDQNRVFADLGQGVLTNAFAGMFSSSYISVPVSYPYLAIEMVV
jgi:hypothetical protein